MQFAFAATELNKNYVLQGSLIELLNKFKRGSDQHEVDEVALKELTKRVSRLCPDPQKALEHLDVLLKIKDREVFTLLERHLDSTKLIEVNN